MGVSKNTTKNTRKTLQNKKNRRLLISFYAELRRNSMSFYACIKLVYFVIRLRHSFSIFQAPPVGTLS